ncbi:DNA-binding response regulator [Pedobacter sp. G11]|uniref:LytR/AlgR family response regulator transcription factor n=1 Tax=Pedobacter sp. G11 TaxID=2482728 RepID=UPI000F5DAD9C|nr:LytTR family DNA-binding domain-containing protein [Pedobacter sp. G11]AZI24104.1 DNA-binding response regulator [Pedobacter sp. G11]
MKLKCIIVDDDIHAINGLKSYINLMPQLELSHIYTDPLEALTEINSLKAIDIIFMDVDMPVINGIELSKSIRHKTNKLIFTTSHSKYAYDAFEIHANDFLLKPYTMARFADTINRHFPKSETASNSQTLQKDDYFFVRNKNERNNLVRIKFAEVIFIESLQNYIRIHTLNDSVVTYMSLGEIKLVLKDQPDFIQIHRSFVISQSYISKVEGNTIYMTDGTELTIGKFYREQVMDFIKMKTIRSNRF